MSTQRHAPRLARRKVLTALGAVAGLSWLGGCTFRPKKTQALAEVEGQLGAWQVVEVRPLVAGAIPVRMRAPDGREFQVDVLRADPQGPRGVAQTGALALYLANGGRGDTPSREDEARGARLLAQRLAQVEAERGAPEIPGLLTLSQRLAAHSQAVLTPWS